MPTQLGTGFGHVGEGYYLRGPRRAFWNRLVPAPLCLYLHGATSSGTLVPTNPAEAKLLRLLSARFAVVCSDWGGPTEFGNDNSLSRIHEGITTARASLNVDQGPVVLVGLSMGAGEALAYALAHPENVA